MKSLIWIGVIVGSGIGGWLGSLLGGGAFGWQAILLSTLGGIGGIWAAYKFNQNFGE